MAVAAHMIEWRVQRLGVNCIFQANVCHSTDGSAWSYWARTAYTMTKWTATGMGCEHTDFIFGELGMGGSLRRNTAVSLQD